MARRHALTLGAGAQVSARSTRGRWRRMAAATVSTQWAQLAIVLAMLAALPFARAVDNDFWWHLRTGEYILRSGIPRHDPYSWTAGGQPWSAHEWLSEVVIYLTQTSLGYAGNMVLFIGVAIAALLTSYHLARRMGAGSKPLLTLMVLAAATLAIFVTPRPQVFTWLFFALYLYVLAKDDRGEDAPLWALPPLMLLWANMHLGFFFGLMLVGCWLAARAIDAARGRAVRWRTPIVVAAACVVAASVNPSGPAILWYPARYVFDSQVTNTMVAEWQRPDPTSLSHAPIFVTALLLVLAMMAPSRPRPFLWLVSLAVVALSMQAVRNAPFAALVVIPVAGSALAGRWPSLHRTHDTEARIPLAVAAALVVAVAASVGTVAVRRTGVEVAIGAPSEDQYPAQAAAFVKERHSGQRLFNEYNHGGYLIDKLYPDVRVFIDGRTDFYGNALLQDYLVIQGARPGWEELIERYAVDVALLNATSPLARALQDDARWTREYDDGRYVVYGRH